MSLADREPTPTPPARIRPKKQRRRARHRAAPATKPSAWALPIMGAAVVAGVDLAPLADADRVRLLTAAALVATVGIAGATTSKPAPKQQQRVVRHTRPRALSDAEVQSVLSDW